jgi:hypothetical protein
MCVCVCIFLNFVILLIWWKKIVEFTLEKKNSQKFLKFLSQKEKKKKPQKIVSPKITGFTTLAISQN